MPETNPATALPAPLRIYQLSVGHYRSSALALVVKLSIADKTPAASVIEGSVA